MSHLLVTGVFVAQGLHPPLGRGSYPARCHMTPTFRTCADSRAGMTLAARESGVDGHSTVVLVEGRAS